MKGLGILVAAVCVVAACKSKERTADSTTMGSAAGMVGTTSSAMATPAPTPAPVAAPLTDANVVEHLRSDDSAEVKLGRLVASKGTNPAVRSYGQMLVTDHTSGAKAVAAVVKKDSLAPIAAASDAADAEHREDFERFNAMPKGKDFDTAFVNHTIEDHTKEISMLQSAQSSMQNENVKALIEKTLPVMQKHLDKAKEIQTKLAGT